MGKNNNYKKHVFTYQVNCYTLVYTWSGFPSSLTFLEHMLLFWLCLFIVVGSWLCWHPENGTGLESDPGVNRISREIDKVLLKYHSKSNKQSLLHKISTSMNTSKLGSRDLDPASFWWQKSRTWKGCSTGGSGVLSVKSCQIKGWSSIHYFIVMSTLD